MRRTETIAGLIAIAAVVAVAMFAGCVEEKEATPTAMPATPVPPPKTVAATLEPTLVLTYQDSEYADWVIDTSYSIALDLGLMTSAAERLVFEGVERYSGMLYDDAKKALDEIDQFDVSSQ